MGICASLCRVDTAPRARARAKDHPPAAAAEVVAAAAPHATVTLGFAAGFAERYEVGEELGHGQFAVVRAAREHASGEAVAVKLIPKALLNDAPDNAEHIRREVSILRALRGKPHVVRLHEAYEDDAEVQLVLQLCTGGELFDRVMREGHFSERRAAGIMRAVLTMLAECHLAGVVHRDIKPENFLYASKHRDAPLVAVDFGSAAYCAPGQLLTELAGSLFYVAPEVLRRRYGPPADLWSAGVLMHVLLSGTLPFLAPTEAGTYAAVLAGKLHLSHAPWPAVSGHARSLLRALLQRDPAARPTAAAALSHPWLRDVPRHDGGGPGDVPLDAAALAALGRFAHLGRLRRAALRALATATPQAELPADVIDQYAAVDADCDGRVTRGELRAALSRLADAARAANADADADADATDSSGGEGSGAGSEAGSVAGSLLSETEAGEAAAALDADGDDVITLRDFAAAALRPGRTWAAAGSAPTPAAAAAARARWLTRARAAFDDLDADRDGIIGPGDLRRAGEMQSGDNQGQGGDADEHINFVQFCRLLRGEPLTPPQARSGPQPPADAVAAEATAAKAGTTASGGDEAAEDEQARDVEAAGNAMRTADAATVG